MKTPVLLICLAAVLATGCAAVRPHDDSWFGGDKAKHFIVSGLISGTAATIAENTGTDHEESFYVAFGITLSLGAGKEAYDLNVRKTGWSWKDIAWDAMGAVAGYGIVRAFYR